MCIYCNTKNYRKIYENHIGPITLDCDGRSLEIHHCDGNHNNNHPDNLKLVTIQEHYEIHRSQGDWAACKLISSRMRISIQEHKQELSRATTEANLQRVKDGIHPFIGPMLNQSRIEKGTHNFLGPENNRKRVIEGKHNFLGKSNTQKQLAEGKHPSQKTWKCPYCNKEGRGTGIYSRYHGNKCKFKTI
jgi:hypothetical protein